MRNNTKHITDKVRDEIVEPVARGAAAGTQTLAKGSEKLAKGSESFAETAQKMADKTQRWADDVTGARQRRNLLLLALAMTIIGVVVASLLKSDD